MSIDILQAAETAEIIVLSAPGVNALRGAAWQLLGQLRAFANGAPAEPFTLADLAYTLKSCRDASTCRAAFVVRRLDDLAAGLEHYLRARDEADAIVPRSVTAGRHGELVTILRGDVAADAGAARLLAGAAAQTMARVLWASRDLENVALIWVRGGRLDWDALRDGPPPRRLAWLDEAPPESGAPPCAGDAPAAGIEPGLAAIWQALFDLPSIGRHQDFFALGGDSQLGLRMLAQVRERHGIDLPLRYLYEAPTIARMSETIVRLAALAPSAGDDDATEYEEGFIR
ncbi:hypothetical protein WK94_15965 [Burkholderia ubonensis]|uniref:phosphopantetheine-binding protein n=1 Tax=Burkholderia ubonensis TaxID=101571 RepID=UPI00075354DF|nr:phosphopantetheine-binding protein [Burkholderia ubonensis]KVW21648.1 hypothetical protein WK94_15965 [Burkholderia ubonensis]